MTAVAGDTTSASVEYSDCDPLRIILCCLAAFLLNNLLDVASCISYKVIRFLNRKTPEDERTEKVAAELREKKLQLESLSPTAEFAAYFKTERHLNKLNDEYQKLVSNRQKAILASSLSIKGISFVFTAVVCIALMLYSRSVLVGHMDPDYFWPFNCLLCLPNVFPPSIENGTPVSLFSMVCISLSVWQLSRKWWKEKKHFKQL